MGYFLLSGLLFAAIRQDIKVARGEEGRHGQSGWKAEDETESTDGCEVCGTLPRLQDYSINARFTRATRALRSRQMTSSILKPRNITFEPGTLNVIMGPSGSARRVYRASMANRAIRN